MSQAAERVPGPNRDLLTWVVRDGADIVVLASLAGTVDFVNAAGRRLLGVELEAAGAAPSLADLFLPDDAPFVRELIFPTLERGGRWNGDVRLRHFGSGAAVPVACSVFHVLDPDTGSAAAIALTGHDLTERGRAEQRLRTLADAGATLAHSLDYAETLENLSELLVREFATFCVIDLFERHDDGRLRIERAAAEHADRSRRADMERLRAFVPAETNLEHPVIRILNDGSSSLVELMPADWVARMDLVPDHAALYVALVARSLLTVPLVANGKLLGALMCGLGLETRPPMMRPLAYDAEDLFFAEELGRRAGVALENARAYERERRIAIVLQAASLPRSLPQAGYIRLDAEYRPGNSEATVGGDWYDAFELDDGRFALTVGDVLGNGLRAAVTMTKLRQAIQTAAGLHADPNVMLDAADRMLRLHDPDIFATAVAAIYDPATDQTSFACAGHPGPLLRTIAGLVEEPRCVIGLPLGLRTGRDDRRTTLVPTPPGSTLVFFTDGLVEMTRDLDEGYRRVCGALSSAGVFESDRPARLLLESALQGREARDDVAVLVATMTGGYSGAKKSPASTKLAVFARKISTSAT
jgi:PAS domain-containing protein